MNKQINEIELAREELVKQFNKLANKVDYFKRHECIYHDALYIKRVARNLEDANELIEKLGVKF